MKKTLLTTVFALAISIFLMITVSAEDNNFYKNGSDFVEIEGGEFYSNIDDQDKLYYFDKTTGAHTKILDEHIITMIDVDQCLYLLTYEGEKSNLLKFNTQDNSVSIEKSFDSFVTNIVVRDSVLYYVEKQNIFTYNLKTKENSVFVENENVDFIYFTEWDTLKYLVKSGNNYDTKIYDFNEKATEQNEVSLFSLQNESEISLMAASSYSPRLSAPSTTNSYYIHTSYGGLNECIHISGGSVLPNCTGYAWGRSYENLGSRPSLSKANAEYWYGTNDGYSRGKTPYLGAVACWRKGIVGDDPSIEGSDAGHVAVVEQIDGDVVITSESGYNSSRWWKTTRSASHSNFSYSSSYSFQGFIYVCGRYVYTEAPSNPKIKIYTDKVAAGNSILFEYSVKNAENMYIAIDVNGKREHFIEVWGDHYNGTFTKPGHYAATLYCTNSIGDSGFSNWVEFDVYNTPPTSPKLAIYKDIISPNEAILFEFSAKDAKNMYIAIDVNGQREHFIEVTTDHYNGTFSKLGKYEAALYCTNEFGNSGFSNWVTFYVGKYNVAYNANGGSGAPSTQIKGHSKTLTLSSTKPTRTGYTFKNWNTKANGSGTSYNSGASYTSNSAITLYAQWTPITYKVAYNANGGSGSMSNSTHTYDTAKTLTSCAFSKTGYTFAGWATSSSGSVAHSNGASVKNLTSTSGGTVTLYAKWTPITYKVAYNANGGSGSMSNSTHTYDTAKTLTSNSFSKTGYTFAGWATSSGGSVAYSNGASVKNLTSTSGGSVTLYAKWTPNTYTLTFDANGGAVEQTNKNITYDSTYGTLPTPIRNNYQFKGWYTAKEDGVLITDTTKVSTTTAQTLYAQWEKLTPYTQIKKVGNSNYSVELFNLDSGCTVIFATYQNGKLVEFYPTTYDGNKIPFTTTKQFDTIKVMVWSNFTTLKPLCEVNSTVIE